MNHDAPLPNSTARHSIILRVRPRRRMLPSTPGFGEAGGLVVQQGNKIKTAIKNWIGHVSTCLSWQIIISMWVLWWILIFGSIVMVNGGQAMVGHRGWSPSAVHGCELPWMTTTIGTTNSSRESPGRQMAQRATAPPWMQRRTVRWSPSAFCEHFADDTTTSATKKASVLRWWENCASASYNDQKIIHMVLVSRKCLVIQKGSSAMFDVTRLRNNVQSPNTNRQASTKLLRTYPYPRVW